MSISLDLSHESQNFICIMSIKKKKGMPREKNKWASLSIGLKSYFLDIETLTLRITYNANKLYYTKYFSLLLFIINVIRKMFLFYSLSVSAHYDVKVRRTMVLSVWWYKD